MDDEDFEDLFAEAELLEGSSQESLTEHLADLNVIDQIEDVFEGVTEAILREDELSIAFRRRPRTRSNAGRNPSATLKQLRFPGKTADEAWRFSAATTNS